MDITFNMDEMAAAIRDYAKRTLGYDVGIIHFNHNANAANVSDRYFIKFTVKLPASLPPKIEEKPVEKPLEPATAVMPKLDVD